MPRCASSFVIAAYRKVRLIPLESRALPESAPAKAGGLFTKPSSVYGFRECFYQVIFFDGYVKSPDAAFFYVEWLDIKK
jgi:hypothetical protein